MTTIEGLERKFMPLREAVTWSVEFPEPGIKLDLASRSDDQTRIFKYLHQMCMLHAENFARANQVKLSVLVDGYLQSCKAKNPLGPYLYARAILELAAFLRDVSGRAIAIHSKPVGEWRVSGEEFFGLIVRARFASSDPEKLGMLPDLSKNQSKPISVMNSIRQLAEKDDTASLARDYDKLCDFVHHNLSSQIASTVGVRQGSSARSAGGGMLLTKNSGPITRYEYPIPSKGELAVKETLPIVEKSMEVCVASLNSMPRTPYSESLLLERTGSIYGLVRLAQ